MNGGKIDILRPFGPSIAKLEIPDNIIKSLNEYAEKVILDEAKLEKLDNGKNLAGNRHHMIQMNVIINGKVLIMITVVNV